MNDVTASQPRIIECEAEIYDPRRTARAQRTEAAAAPSIGALAYGFWVLIMLTAAIKLGVALLVLLVAVIKFPRFILGSLTAIFAVVFAAKNWRRFARALAPSS